MARNLLDAPKNKKHVWSLSEFLLLDESKCYHLSNFEIMTATEGRKVPIMHKPTIQSSETIEDAQTYTLKFTSR